MKAGQLIKVLQLVDPNEEVQFSVCHDMEQRKQVFEAFKDPYIFTTDLVPTLATIDCDTEGFYVEIELTPLSILESD